MRQVGFAEANQVLQRPPSMTEDECGTLEVYQDERQSISCWLLSAEDLERVKSTHRIWLRILGRQPPVALSTEPPRWRVELKPEDGP